MFKPTLIKNIILNVVTDEGERLSLECASNKTVSL